MLDSPYGGHSLNMEGICRKILSEVNKTFMWMIYFLNGFLGESFDYHSSVENLTVKGWFQAYQVDFK